MTVRPADFAPAVAPGEFLTAPSDPADERIEVGILIVGGGPAGLAAAIRAAQLLAERPELAESLGDVPICVVEKGKAPGSHVLSGAVVDPRALRALFPGVSMDELPFHGTVEDEAVYYLTRRRALRVPAPPTMRNHGNRIASLSRLCRWLAERAEELGVTIVPETAAVSLLESEGRVVGIRTGDRGRGRSGEELANFEPGSDIVARMTILAEGTLGHLTRAAVERFGLAGEAPQVYALGVKEVWEVARPLRRIVHTLGWPLSSREFGGSFLYPLGEGHVSLGLVAGLDTSDASVSVHDLLQALKLHPLVGRVLEGGRRVGWGAKTIPEGGLQALPAKLHFPGGVFVGDAAGFVNVPALKGVHYAIHSGHLAAEAAIEAIAPGSTSWAPGALEGYDRAVRESFIWRDLRRVRNMRPAFARGFLAGSALAGLATVTGGRAPRGNLRLEADAHAAVSSGGRARSYPQPDGVLTFDKLSSVYLSGNRTRDDAPDHIRVRHDVPGELAAAWVAMCPAAVYELAEGGGVAVTASNCVQCGAITAKGGRLTPPEGGDGPDYQLM
ncbi:MAG: 4Fe-4S dicluster domain-containing protein [Thermoleophilia bacterium]|nr:4Fe-4S dicluster domain-containing protein [Thermoleophilia bacterium]